MLTDVECASAKPFEVETAPSSTKIHLRTHVHGLPIGLTPREVRDSTAYIDLMMDGRDSESGILLGSILSKPPERSVSSLKKGAEPMQVRWALLHRPSKVRG